MYDCFGDARDWLRQERKLLLPNYPRDPNWWSDPKSPELLEDKMEAAGFYEIGIEALRPGDAFLAKPFRALKVCHCGIYLGDGLIYHHYGTPASDRLSLTESIYDMQRYITRYIRHRDLDVQPSASGS
jgi:cell wall-associated NlpC family hydrolase